MYAIIESGGKQYKVAPGQTANIDLLGVAPGTAVELDKVLFVADGAKTVVGKPTIAGAKVIASCVTEALDDKVIAFKYKAKVRYRRKIGHRQPYTKVTIEKIVMPGETPEPEVKSNGA